MQEDESMGEGGWAKEKRKEVGETETKRDILEGSLVHTSAAMWGMSLNEVLCFGLWMTWLKYTTILRPHSLESIHSYKKKKKKVILQL